MKMRNDGRITDIETFARSEQVSLVVEINVVRKIKTR